MIRLFIAMFAALAGSGFSTSLLAEPYGSGWYGEVEMSLGHEDNLARSFIADDDTRDIRASLSVGGGYAANLGERFRYVASGYLAHTGQEEFSKLDNTAASLGFALDFQPSRGYSSTWFRAAADVTYRDYRDSEAREGYLFRGALSANRRLTTATTGRLGYRYLDMVFLNKTENERNRDAAFDIARHEVFVGVDYQLSRQTFVVVEYSFAHGGFTSSASAPPAVSIEYDAQTQDPAFETCNERRCVPWEAYRSVADIHALELALVSSVGAFDVDISGRFVDARSETGLTYDNWIAQLAVIWSF